MCTYLDTESFYIQSLNDHKFSICGYLKYQVFSKLFHMLMNIWLTQSLPSESREQSIVLFTCLNPQL